MNIVFAFIAGLLTTLSPCVLPVLPFVTASSLSRSRFGPAFLGLGLLVSFVGVSLLVSSTGLVLGADPSMVRRVSGLLLMMSGFLFLSQRLSDWFTAKLSFISGSVSKVGHPDSKRGFFGEFFSGVLLGIVWTPCSGPSLGAALGLASQQENFLKSAVVLFVFGIGAVIPLLLFAYGAKHFLGKIRSHVEKIQKIKFVFGVLIVLFGFLILFELDRNLEAGITKLLPESWIVFVTTF